MAQATAPPLIGRIRSRSTERGRLRRRWLSIGERVIRAVLVIVLVTLGTVGLLRLAPGSVAQVILGEQGTPETIKALNHKLGVDKPFWSQYVDWVKNALHGDLGTSPFTQVKVTTAIFDRLPVTLEIAALALAIALVISLILGTLAAAYEGSAFDRMVNAISSVFLAFPAFVAGPVLIYLLAVKAGAFPVSGWTHFGDDPANNLKGAFLPALAVSLTQIAVFTRLLRSDMVGTLREDYIAAAQAKGMPRAYVIVRHALRPSSFSLITVAGLSFGQLLGGTVVVETLFGLPGLGQLVSAAITTRDVPTVQGVVTFVAVAFVLINMLIDISYGLLDPRVRKTGRG
jgi:peptide/nickel transport system permease protein